MGTIHWNRRVDDGWGNEENDVTCIATGGAADYSYSSRSTCDSDQHAESLGAWSQRYNQLTPGLFRGKITEMWFDGLQLFHEVTNRSIVQTGSSWDDCIVIGVLLHLSSPGLFCKKSFGADSVLVFRGDSGFTMKTPEQFNAICIAIPRAILESLLPIDEFNSLDLLANKAAVIAPHAANYQALRALLDWVLNPVNFDPGRLRHPNIRRTLFADVLDRTLSTLQGSCPADLPTPSFKARSHIVSEAIDFAMSDKLHPPTISDICIRLKISRRLLNYCFQEVLGVNPVAYLRSLRLNGVRRDLRTGGQGAGNVSDVAARWGFWHLPRFAAEYRQLFGELPSKTLQAAAPHRVP